jgi:hypothetical protein
LVPIFENYFVISKTTKTDGDIDKRIEVKSSLSFDV